LKELAVLLEQLAAKLGTTTEKLWGVLIKQATISGTVSLIESIIFVLALIWGFRFVQKQTQSEWQEEGKAIAWIVFTVISTISVIIIFCEIENTINAFLNPEYWALTRILK
jgi:hypothetical protein